MNNKLKETAIKAAENAYAPYSGFKVGAAVLLDNGVVVIGNNQENASYPLGMCAERVALNYAKAQYPDAAVMCIAIASPSTDQVITPCGACRQVMAEVASRQSTDFTVTMVGTNETVVKTVSELLPLAFKLDK